MGSDELTGSGAGTADPSGLDGEAQGGAHVRDGEDARAIGRSIAVPLFGFAALAMMFGVAEFVRGGPRGVILTLASLCMLAGGVLALRLASVRARAKERSVGTDAPSSP